MSGAKNCPETPRQRMIGMMYLVLTAMLALNVSTDILKGFTMVDNSLHASIKSSEVRNAGLYDDFQYLYEQNPTKTKEWLDKANEIHEKADMIFDYIKRFKYEMAVKADGQKKVLANNPLKDDEEIPDVIKVEANSNLDISGEYGIVLHHGDTLKEMIEQYRDYMIKCAENDSNKISSIKSIFNTENGGTNQDGDTLSWVDGMFDGMPLGATMTILTKFQNDVRNMEGEMVTYLKNKTDASDFRVNRLEALVVPKSTYVLRGGSYEAQIVLSAVDSTKAPHYIVNGNRIGDNGIYKTGCGSTGTFKYRGQIVLPRNDGSNLELPFESEYSVGEPNATVSNTDLNVVYRGYDNHFSISVPGVSDDQITASADGGTINKVGKEYIVKPGNGTELRIHVKAKLNGNLTPMGEYRFRIKPLPKPSAFVVVNGNVHEDVKIPRSLVINPDCHLEANYGKDGLLNMNFRINEFMIMTPDGTIDGKGNKFTTRQMESIKKLKKGDYLNIVNIRASAPSGAEIKLAPIPLILN